MSQRIITLLLSLAATLPPPMLAVPAASDAEKVTIETNTAVLNRYPFSDKTDFEDAQKGFIGTIPDALIKDKSGRTVWNQGAYRFLSETVTPDTAHPALWRQAQLNAIHGLFEVTDRIYQVRGFDISNITIVEGDTGIIIIDPLTYIENSKAALDLYFQHRPRKPVVAIIYTHSHLDHFGGAKGVINESDVTSGKVPIIGPVGFLEEAVSENVLAGPAMIRRSAFQFGSFLPIAPKGTIDAGLGKASLGGTPSLIPPTDLITKATDTRKIDGVEMVFQLTPSSEAPAEFHIYFPQFKALNLAENATHTLHNLLPLRGAQVRDALAWSRYLNDSIEQFARKSDVLFAQHHWPTWGQKRLVEAISRQRDTYKFIHDQTLRFANQGFTADEIAERLHFPSTLEKDWATHGLYGSLRHNVRAVYQRYLGWYDANPAKLDPLPPVDLAKKYVAYMGGAEAILAKAHQDYSKGEYRWVANVLNHLVYAEPENSDAKELEAAALEQLGYQSESATWRNAYLQGAFELRGNIPSGKSPIIGTELARGLTVDNLFDAIAIRLDADKAEGKTILINWTFTDLKRDYLLALDHSVITSTPNKKEAEAHVGVTLDRQTFIALVTKQTTFPEALLTGKVELEGNPLKLAEFFGLLETFPTTFPVLTPRNTHK
jgi:alkyl sulfatase BDS1-like metallo-beta-lactamase superfamily hydrolase